MCVKHLFTIHITTETREIRIEEKNTLHGYNTAIFKLEFDMDITREF